MSLPTERTEHFVLKEDGKIYHVTMPPEDACYTDAMSGPGSYEYAVQSAISNAVEVSNQDDVRIVLFMQYPEFPDQVKINNPYSLQCSVEKKEIHDFEKDCDTNSFYNTKLVALVTFSQPEREETQDNSKPALIIAKVVHDCVPDVRHDIGLLVVHWLEKEGYQITRKTP